MSDFSHLYKKYSSVSNLTKDLNNSVITLKKRSLLTDSKVQAEGLKVSDEDTDKAKKSLQLILSMLEQFYNKQDIHNDLYELMDNQLFKNQVLENVEFKDKITNALNKLKKNTELSTQDLTNIDQFISVLDNEASVLFKNFEPVEDERLYKGLVCGLVTSD
ncbi:hypothetical protein MKQ68_01680 [Chitinophaga horti]|uniref:Uncharacterized protein n=1 Tax=Chitinophaga horti TaxID=2920382 RepID=A0ABY6J6L4_9BACT|nr:hypothetical protein [Chitinophaga horti]UYQ93804.1 hypothetical protein MKQ68_01680 [Chitinophaga horti]